MKTYTRREVSQSMICFALGTSLVPSITINKQEQMTLRKIPMADEWLPIVGLGTWQSFDVGADRVGRAQRSEVLLRMKDLGGKVIDSSPMYGSSELVVGDLTSKLEIQDHFFYATKVWTSGKESGIAQMENSRVKMKRESLDLIQIHNLVDWKTHVKTLKDWKEKGRISYWGITHYTDASHDSLAKIIKTEKPDFVQFNYSINHRHAEKALLGTAKGQGTAIIINRPFDGGSLFNATKGKPLPVWCNDLDIASWAQYFLKFILSWEAINCVIPGTSKPEHIVDNMMAGYGNLPDSGTRKKMLDYFESI